MSEKCQFATKRVAANSIGLRDRCIPFYHDAGAVRARLTYPERLAIQ